MTNSSKNQTLAEALEKLVGRELSSVTFVRDYVQLAFDGAGLSAYTTLTFTYDRESLSSGQPGYRDSLCRQIGCRVARAEVDNQNVSVVFENGAIVAVSLRDDDYRGPEALQFSLDIKDRTWVV